MSSALIAPSESIVGVDDERRRITTGERRRSSEVLVVPGDCSSRAIGVGEEGVRSEGPEVTTTGATGSTASSIVARRAIRDGLLTERRSCPRRAMALARSGSKRRGEDRCGGVS
ncbi:MAG: hypothetical protein O3C62_06130 [Actinomycetota bacterium]|nr:hypothetical protein [Actinomycetota bacterium]MDA2971842.1 hypothetical protein [Actinomycetota bacterium]MDA3001243.1 hypothetical protein [Actinomycetota bacterium]